MVYGAVHGVKHLIHGARLARALPSAIACLMLFGLAIPRAQAVPSFSRQTGESCASCHIGAYGPQLTPFGIRFKLSGYSDTDGKGLKIPLSAMVRGSFTHTDKSQSSAAAHHFGSNNNVALDEAVAFLAGRLAEHAGTFTQGTYSDIDRSFSLDTTDTRYAQPLTLGGRDAILGLAINNNPATTNPFNRAWRVPFISSRLTPGAAASPLLRGGMGQKVMGASTYLFWNDAWYAEAGGYHSLSHDALRAMGLDDDLGRTPNVASNWRLGYWRDWRKQNIAIGLFGLDAHLQPDRMEGPSNKYQDLGVDVSYQLLGARRHIVTAYASYIHEHQKRDASFDDGESSNRNGRVDMFNINTSYVFKQTYGLELGYFDISGSHDALLYSPRPDHGSRRGSPGTSGYILQTDWTPWGKDESWMSPWANLRLGLQYLVYARFNGAKHNYDGFGRDATDNNTLFFFATTSF